MPEHPPYAVLIVDDELTYAASLARLLGRRGLRADTAGSVAEALERARGRAYDLVVLDQVLPDGSGLDLIAPLRAAHLPPRILMMTAYGTIDQAVEAMRRGAWDYVTKSTSVDEVVERILDARQVAEAARGAGADPAAGAGALADVIGDSAPMRELRQRIGEVARSPDTTVLLGGESGTGKGIVARAIHALSARAAEPLVAVDCVALPPTLAESELFGHERGAFTGADRARPGRLEAAGAGTVLLDEIGDMDPLLQGKLLRVLEERTYCRVGGVRPVEMRARVIAATHRNLPALVAEGRFRLDLYHRLMVFPLRVPALRERGADIVLLAEHFAALFARRLGRPASPLTGDLRAALLSYDFPGNVRELRNIMERAVILADGRPISAAMLPDRTVPAPGRPRAIAAAAAAAPPADVVRAPAESPAATGDLPVAFRPGTDTLETLEDRLIEEALRRTGGNKARAASLLGISRFALTRRLSRPRSG